MNNGKFLIKLDDAKYDKSLQISKNGVQQAADALYNKVLEGETSAVQVAEMINFVTQVATEVKKKTDDMGKNAFVDLVRDQIKANSNGDGTYVTKYGTKLELAETAVSYAFDACKDPLWDFYDQEIKKMDKLKKNREKFLKTITKEYPAGNILIPETGELHENVTLYPPIKTSTSSFKQTLSTE
jgi:hypothetical protein